MKLDDIAKVLTGNGDPENGIVFRVVNLEQKMATMEEILVKLRETSTANHALLREMSNGRSQKKILGVDSVTRGKIWLMFSRLITTGIATWLSIDVASKL